MSKSTSALLNSRQKAELLLLLEEQAFRKRHRKIYDLYPEDGPLSRHAYPKHMRFFELGATYRDRLMLAANRVGKTEGIGGYETTLHLTGEYPPWWKGRRFDHPVAAWAAGKTGQTTRDILQKKLFGPITDLGTGLIPRKLLLDWKRRAGSVPDMIETGWIRHVNGGTSILGMKSFDQGRTAFEGTEQHVIWLDEEAPNDVRVECLIRLMTTKGLLIFTFTPLQGLTDAVLAYLPGGRLDGPPLETTQAIVNATWDDAPHLTEEDKAELLALIPPYQRDARTKGIPQLGSGAIFPIPEEDIKIADFEIPKHWPRAYAMDVGWNCTAALWGALDRETDTVYLYSTYKQGENQPIMHAHAIKSRGDWISGVIDPASRGRGQKDGERLYMSYTGLGLKLTLAENAVESGLYEIWMRLTTGRLKVFKSLEPWFEEYRLYRRDETGKVIKQNDHLMDCTRYFILSGISAASTQPAPESLHLTQADFRAPGTSWMAG